MAAPVLRIAARCVRVCSRGCTLSFYSPECCLVHVAQMDVGGDFHTPHGTPRGCLRVIRQAGSPFRQVRRKCATNSRKNVKRKHWRGFPAIYCLQCPPNGVLRIAATARKRCAQLKVRFPYQLHKRRICFTECGGFSDYTPLSVKQNNHAAVIEFAVR